MQATVTPPRGLLLRSAHSLRLVAATEQVPLRGTCCGCALASAALGRKVPAHPLSRFTPSAALGPRLAALAAELMLRGGRVLLWWRLWCRRCRRRRKRCRAVAAPGPPAGSQRGHAPPCISTRTSRRLVRTGRTAGCDGALGACGPSHAAAPNRAGSIDAAIAVMLGIMPSLAVGRPWASSWSSCGSASALVSMFSCGDAAPIPACR